MNRPYVVCHMMGTIDGRIQTERWSLSPAAEKQYEAVHALHKADSWMCGRQTFQGDFLEQQRDAAFPRKATVPPGDFVPTPGKKVVFAVAVDSAGKLNWPSNDMRGDRLVVLTTERAPAGYLADLRAKEIAYFRCGKSSIDFRQGLQRLHRAFGIRKLMLEGGGAINGALLAAGLIDEISLLVCPFADGSRALPTVFDAPESALKRKATALRLIAAKKRPGDVVWLRYAVR